VREAMKDLREEAGDYRTRTGEQKSFAYEVIG
jgi:hypothetical protein